MKFAKPIFSKSKLFLILSSLIFVTFSAKAQQNQDIINQQDWITRQQQNQIEENKRDKEQDTIRKERLRIKKEEQLRNEKLPVTGGAAKCFAIQEINLTNANSLSKSEKRKLSAPYIGKCIDGKVLSELVNAINKYYNEKGFVTAQVNVLQQNIQSGKIELKVLEGKIEEIIVGNNGLREKMQKYSAFGSLQGNILNIQDINQGLYQINRLASNNATMKIEPGVNEGEAKVYIANDKKFPVRATIGYDNLGNEFTGVKRTNFSGSMDNLLSLNDNISLSYSTNLNDDSQTRDIKSFTSGISIPLHYYTFSYDYSRSEFRGTNQGITGPLKLTGYSDRNNITIDRVLLNKTGLRISTSAGLTAKESASYLNQVKIETSQRKLTIANFALLISSSFKNGASLYLKPSYARGLKILNAKQDDENLDKSIPKAQFEAFKFYASLSKKFTIPKLEIPVLLSAEMDSQFAKQTLFGSEQFSVGGFYSVRGFRETYIVGDSGYYIRNKANFNLGSIVKSQNPYLVHLNKFKLEPFYDFGYVRNKYNGSDGRLSGAGLKTIFESKYFNASLTYSRGLSKSKLVTSPKKENELIYFEISTTCC